MVDFFGGGRTVLDTLRERDFAVGGGPGAGCRAWARLCLPPACPRQRAGRCVDGRCQVGGGRTERIGCEQERYHDRPCAAVSEDTSVSAGVSKRPGCRFGSLILKPFRLPRRT